MVVVETFNTKPYGGTRGQIISSKAFIAHQCSEKLKEVFVYRLRPIDVEFMKRLGKIVSIVPVIAKADTLTIEERQEFKERVMKHTSTCTTKLVFFITFFSSGGCSDCAA